MLKDWKRKSIVILRCKIAVECTSDEGRSTKIVRLRTKAKTLQGGGDREKTSEIPNPRTGLVGRPKLSESGGEK